VVPADAISFCEILNTRLKPNICPSSERRLIRQRTEEQERSCRAVPNSTRRFVQKGRARSSGRQTQRALHEALIALIREKDYDEVAGREILDRANVGRSTFYTHYRDKDELLVSGIHEMVRAVSSATPLRSASRRERFTWFSLPVLEHYDRHRHSSGTVGKQAPCCTNGFER
jgi:hypothetical protein